MRFLLKLLLVAIVAGAVLAVVFEGSGEESRKADRAPAGDSSSPSKPSSELVATPCPPGLADCRSASGRIIFVEAVDPDGDGDAHFVLASSESVTGPGISIVDVRPDLRPEPLPGIGDRLSAAGPVQRGSRGQSQIHAVAVHVAYD